MDDVFEPSAPDPRALFLADVLAGLCAAEKTLPCQYFYDEIGSALFEEITELPEYYPTRTEISILKTHTADIADALGPDVLLVEYGAGASTKTRILLDALRDPAAYVPIDVSRTFLLQTAEALRDDYPSLPVYPITGDFMGPLSLSGALKGHRVGFFPGSTIGNLGDDAIKTFLSGARQLLGPNSQFLLGVDLSKSPDILIPAYDDARGVTARFNLNLLARINRELEADFDLTKFAHRAIWNEEQSRIEMHLKSLEDQIATIGENQITFSKGETIHTENSRKFSIDSLTPLFEQAGWTLKKQWLDQQDYFAVLLFQAR